MDSIFSTHFKLYILCLHQWIEGNFLSQYGPVFSRLKVMSTTSTIGKRYKTVHDFIAHSFSAHVKYFLKQF